MAESQRICQSSSKYACTIRFRTATIWRQGTWGWREVSSGETPDCLTNHGQVVQNGGRKHLAGKEGSL